MKLYKTTITPTSNFATTLKGDTLFGQMCWAIRYKYGEKRLAKLLKDYENKPFLIVSDGFASGYLPKPSLPSILLGENSDEKKINRKKIWLTLEDLHNGNFLNAKTDAEINNSDFSNTVVKNSINYKTFTTEGNGFDPYGEDEYSISSKDIYFLIDEDFSLDELKECFQLLSKMGYGKNTTIGKGRFEFSEFEAIDVKTNSSVFMTLSPSSINNINCKNSYYEPFTRFGKHGANLANKNPFKKPLLLADSGAVIVFEDSIDLKYIGKSIKGHSTHEETVHQGYSIVLSLKGLNDVK